MIPMSLARVTLEETPSVRGVGVNPWRQAGTHSRSWGWLMEKPSRRRRRVNRHLRRDGKAFLAAIIGFIVYYIFHTH
jgi:hypothetical protein